MLITHVVSLFTVYVCYSHVNDYVLIYVNEQTFRWERKLPMSKSPLESTWLYHEIGRCYLELDQFEEAKSNGQQSETAAIEADDQMWHLQALVLTAQAEGKVILTIGLSTIIFSTHSVIKHYTHVFNQMP